VNQYIGTAAEGQTFPIAGLPHAMTDWTPQTREGNVKCVAPYYFEDKRIQGFRGSNFMSGSCMMDYGSLTLMPISGALRLDDKERASSFNRTSEQAAPYRYAVTLDDYKIDAQMTGTTRAEMLQFRYRQSGKAWLLIECNSNPNEGEVRVDTERNEVIVINPVRRQYAGSGKPAGFSSYFVIQFDHPLHVGGTWTGNGAGKNRHEGSTSQSGTGGAPGTYISFDLRPGETVTVKVGSSFTSVEEARRNLKAEIADWNFQQLVSRVRAEWNRELGSITIDADETHKRIFYTALYHSLLLPRTYSDVSGTYPRFAGHGKIETANGFTYYCDYSLWDTFRALHPLLTLLQPDRELDMVKSLIAKGEQGGFLPEFPMWNRYTAEMIGDHGVAEIADAYAKGIRDFDTEAAYRLMRKNAMELPASTQLYKDGEGRRGLTSYLKYGFIPLEDPVADAFHTGEQVSRTLEYAYDDFLVGEMASALGHDADAKTFSKRAQNYQNVIDVQTGFARGRHADGSWDTPFNPAGQYRYITEGLPYQYTFFALQDIDGLITRLGGRDAFVAKLDGLFAGNYYDHGNEPSHHIAYLYDNAGAAWKTQQHVRNIMDTLYIDAPNGLAGNDDAGQMSAWYVMSALGFYSVTPGTPKYEIGTPLFDDAVIHLPNGKQFHIRAVGAGAGKKYIRKATLNGKPLESYWLTQSEIIAGGELVFEMSSVPVPAWPKGKLVVTDVASAGR